MDQKFKEYYNGCYVTASERTRKEIHIFASMSPAADCAYKITKHIELNDKQNKAICEEIAPKLHEYIRVCGQPENYPLSNDYYQVVFEDKLDNSVPFRG